MTNIVPSLRLSISILILALCPVQTGLADESQWDSPAGDIRIVSRPGKNEGERQLWVESTQLPARKAPLFSYRRSGNVVISPDSSHIAFNYHYSSTDSTVLVFQRREGLNFVLAENLDLAQAVKRFYQKVSGSTVGIDHWYVDCLSWSGDSQSLLLKAYGHGKDRDLSGWFCVYSLANNQPSLSLDVVNK